MVGARGPGQRQIAVLAEEDLVGALRLAGVRLARVMPSDAAAVPKIRAMLREWLVDDGIGVIIIAESLARLVEDQLDSWRAERRLFPVILQVPSPGAARHADVRGYYRRLSRDYLGLEIVLEESRVPPAAREPDVA